MGWRRARPLRWLLRRVAVVLALPVVVPAAVLGAANTEAGRHLVGWAVAELSAGQVRLEGLAGVLPHRPRAALVEVHDAAGAWIRAEGVAVDVDLLGLLRGEIVVDSLASRAVVVARRPAPVAPAVGPIRLPLAVRLERVAIARLSIDSLLPDAPALALEGNAVVQGSNVTATVEAAAADRADRYRLRLSREPRGYRLDLDLAEESGGLLGVLAAHRGLSLPPPLDGAIRLAAAGTWTDGTWHVEAARLDAGAAEVRVRGAASAEALALDWSLDLRDLGIVLPGAVGSIQARGEVRGSQEAPRVAATATSTGLALPGAVRVADVAVDARLSDLFGSRHVDGSARLTGLAAAAITGDVRLTVEGPLEALGLAAEGSLRAGGEPVGVDVAGRLDGASRRLAVERLEARVRGETLRLLAPATVDFSDGVAVEPLRAGLRQGAVEIAGRLSPGLALDATVTGVPADLLRHVVPGPPLSGTVHAEARLTDRDGSVGGSVRARVEGLRSPDGVGRGLPPVNAQVTARLGAGGAEIEARAEAGKGARLGLTGRIGGGATTRPAALDLRADGRLDLALLDPVLAGAGRRARGQASLDGRVTGTLDAPRLDGSLRLVEGALWDRTLGLAVTDALGRVALTGDTLRVEGLTARAGPGTLALDGTVGLLAPGIPVDLRLEARGARPLQRDELDLQGDGELRLTGSAGERLMLFGAVRLDGVEIRLPERLPAAVATLEVREEGRRRAAPAATGRSGARRLDLAIDLALSAPRKVEVRGRGVDAELGGEVRVQGTLADPVVTGGVDLIRGQFNLVGQPLRFSRGRIAFHGAAGLDPALDLEARATAAGGTAILAVSGTAGAPRIELRGEPEMPQDEVLSRLLFGVAGGRLSPWQATRLGLAAAALAGERAPGAGALTRAGRALGLGRLGLIADEKGEAGIEGGRDLGDRAYLGARQSSRTGEPQGVLRFEASRQIRLEADVGPVGGSRAGIAFEHEF